jgi:hypothetical protein
LALLAWTVRLILCIYSRSVGDEVLCCAAVLLLLLLQVQLELDAAGVDYSPGSSSWDVNTPQPIDKVRQLGTFHQQRAHIAC